MRRKRKYSKSHKWSEAQRAKFKRTMEARRQMPPVTTKPRYYTIKDGRLIRAKFKRITLTIVE